MIKLKVTTHSGDEDIVAVKEYSASDLAKQMNDNEVHSIVIGDMIYSRIDLKNVKPIKD